MYDGTCLAEPSHHPPEEIEGWLLIGPGIEESCEVFVSEDIHTGTHPTLTVANG